MTRLALQTDDAIREGMRILGRRMIDDAFYELKNKPPSRPRMHKEVNPVESFFDPYNGNSTLPLIASMADMDEGTIIKAARIVIANRG